MDFMGSLASLGFELLEDALLEKEGCAEGTNLRIF